MSFKNPIYVEQIGGTGWEPPDDWLDISDVAHNEIQFLSTDAGEGIGLKCTIASGGTYNIDWGDGTVETNRASGTSYGHIYAYGTGTAVADGFTIFKARIYTDGNDLQRIQFVVNPLLPVGLSNNNQLFSSLLALAIDGSHYTTWNYLNEGTPNLRYFKYCIIKSWGSATSAASLFSNCKHLIKVELPNSWESITTVSSMFINCENIPTVNLPTNWSSITTTAQMFGGCYMLNTLVLPTSWGTVNNVSQMFYYCTSLPTITLPTSWGSITTTASMFYNCYLLTTVALPTSWGSITTTNQMFYGCYNIVTISLPTSWGSITDIGSMFYNCYNLTYLSLPSGTNSITAASSFLGNCYALQTAVNLDAIGSTTTVSNLYGIHGGGYQLSGSLSFGAKLSRFGINGQGTALLQISSLRLTNTTSTWSGSSPQVYVGYTNLDATALNTLFSDIVATGNFSGKTINITSAAGAATCDKTIITNAGGIVVG